MNDETKPPENKDYDFSETWEKDADFHFLIDSQIIDVAQEYTYLGTGVSSSGNLSESREHLEKKTFNDLFSLRRHVNHF